MRQATVQRTTKETDILTAINLDDASVTEVDTGIGFLDHMLILLAKHGRFGLTVKAKGDLWIDCHHTTEDIGLALGEAFKQALGDKKQIERFGDAWVPMDEVLSQVVVDISGRPYLVLDAPLQTQRLGTFETETVEDFFRAFAFAALMNLHLRTVYGRNTHHVIESLFKGLGRALRKAVTINEAIDGVNSSKGVI